MADEIGAENVRVEQPRHPGTHLPWQPLWCSTCCGMRAPMLALLAGWLPASVLLASSQPLPPQSVSNLSFPPGCRLASACLPLAASWMLWRATPMPLSSTCWRNSTSERFQLEALTCLLSFEVNTK